MQHLLGRSPAKVFAHVLGFVMTAASAGIFAPIVMTLARTRDPSGMSKLTWALQLAGFSLVPIAPIRRGYPLMSYCEYFVLTTKSLAINAMIYTFGGSCAPADAACACLAAIGAYYSLVSLLPERYLVGSQALAAAILTLAPLPQITSNFLGRTGGGWSPTSAAVATVGNVIRVFTTLRLAKGDRALLLQFSLGTVLNALMLGQILVWG